MYLNFSIFNVFLKNRNIIFKMKISKVTDYAALICQQCLAIICSRRHFQMHFFLGALRVKKSGEVSFYFILAQYLKL